MDSWVTRTEQAIGHALGRIASATWYEGAHRDWTWRRVVVTALAVLGAALLAIIVGTFWRSPGDNLAYWIAGQRLAAGEAIFATGEAAFAPYAYHYTPPLAQLLAPLTLAIPTVAYLVVYRAFEFLAVWGLAGRRILPMFALIAFLPVAVELRFENVHLFMALAIVLGLRRWPWLFAVGAVVKISPGLGIVYLALRRRWRDAAVAAVLGGLIVLVSVVLDPALWAAWVEAVLERADSTGNSLLPAPYLVRAAAGLGLTVAGGVVGRRSGELLLVAGITLANPNLALNGFAVLAAAVPIWLAGPSGVGESSRTPATQPGSEPATAGA
jgi:hypothetical protein